MNSLAVSVSSPDLRRIAEMGNGVLAWLNAVRETGPIVWNDSVRGWLVTRHQDVVDGFQGRYPLSCVRIETRTFSPERLELMSKRYPLMLKSLPNWIVNTDAPRHTHLRALMARAFSKKLVDNLRPFVRQSIAGVLDSIAGQDEVEFVEKVARQITGRVILKKFGLADSYLARLPKWSFTFNAALGGVVDPTLEVMDGAEHSFAEMQEVFSAEVAKRRTQPTEDFLSELVMARDGSDALTEEELLGICYLVIVAGHDTTLNTMALGVAALCEDAAARQYLLQHPESILNFVMEVMRYVAMSTAQNRVAAEDFIWHGVQIRKGDQVWLMIAAANRDPRIYADAERIDMTRSTDQVAVFGPGIHHCIGHMLAKMQLCEFFPAFFTRFPKARLAQQHLEFQPYMAFRGLNRLSVALR
jgi:pimeloyl-[acyl-carrier protein] synthase